MRCDWLLQGHLLCRVPFECTGSEIHASLEYVMAPKEWGAGGGEGLCVYLVDPSVPGWDTHFDGTGPLGFVGKKGAIVGVGIDCGGNFSDGTPGSIAVKRANDSKLLCKPVQPRGGVATSQPEDHWRKLKIKFDIDENKIDVSFGGIKLLDDVKIEGIKIPKNVCIGVCAGTSSLSNHICVNKLKLKGEADDDDEFDPNRLSELRKVFEAFDMDANGIIDLKELICVGESLHSGHGVWSEEQVTDTYTIVGAAVAHSSAPLSRFCAACLPYVLSLLLF